MNESKRQKKDSKNMFEAKYGTVFHSLSGVVRSIRASSMV